MSKGVSYHRNHVVISAHFHLTYCVLFLSRRYPFTADQEIPETDWEVYLRETANAIVSQQTPQR